MTKKIFLKFLILLFVFPQVSKANSLLQKKTSALLDTFISNQSTSFYISLVSEGSNDAALRKIDSITISEADFRNIISSPNIYHRMLAIRPEIEIVKKLRRFVNANELKEVTVGYTNLNAAQNILLNIIFLIEFQKMISERTDLSVYGIETIRNLNFVIAERVFELLPSAERYLGVTIFSRNIAKKIKSNFIYVGLDFENFLSPSDQWLNEYMGLDKKHIDTDKPKVILETLTGISTKRLLLKLKQSAGPQCRILFLK